MLIYRYARVEKETGIILAVELRGSHMPILDEVPGQECVLISPEDARRIESLGDNEVARMVLGRVEVSELPEAKPEISLEDRLRSLNETVRRYVEGDPAVGRSGHYSVEKQLSIQSAMLLALSEFVLGNPGMDRRASLLRVIESCSEALGWIAEVVARRNEIKDQIEKGENVDRFVFSDLSATDPGVKLKDVIPGKTRKP